MDTPGMKILKATVIVMALMLVAGTTLLILRVQERQEHTTPVEKIPAISQLPLAPNGWVVMMTPLGEGLALLVDSMDSSQELVILDQQGNLTRRISLVPVRGPDAEIPSSP